MILPHLVVLCSLCFGGAARQTALDAQAGLADAWHTVSVVQDKGLAVRLKVPRKASLADAGWMTFEFQNAGTDPLTLRGLNYRIECECDHLKTGRHVSSQSLASGNDYDLFPDAWKTTPVADRVVQAASLYRVVEQPSDYSATLLGLPPRNGLRVRAHIHFHVELKDRCRLDTPPQRGSSPAALVRASASL